MAEGRLQRTRDAYSPREIKVGVQQADGTWIRIVRAVRPDDLAWNVIEGDYYTNRDHGDENDAA